MVTRLILTIVSLLVPALAQQLPWYSTQVFTNYTTAGVIATAPIYNSGWTSHRLLVQTKNVPAQVCDIAGVDVISVTLQFSVDGAIWYNAQPTIGVAGIVYPGYPPATGSTGAAEMMYAGAYPYIRVQVAYAGPGFAAGNCRMDAWYTGTVSPSVPIAIVGGGVPSGSGVNKSTPIQMGATEVTGTPPLLRGLQSTSTPPYSLGVAGAFSGFLRTIQTDSYGDLISVDECTANLNASYPVTVGANATVKIATVGASAVIRVCSLFLTASAGGNLKLVSGTGATCGTGSADLSGTFTVAAGGSLPFPGPSFLSLSTSQDLCLTTTNNAAVAGIIRYVVH